MTQFLNAAEDKSGPSPEAAAPDDVAATGEKFPLAALPAFENTAFAPDIPYELTYEQFEALPVSEQCLRARALILGLQEWICGQEGSFGADAITPIHRFTRGGMYCRELTMPAGLLIVGKRHAKEHLVVMTKGACTLFTERGREELSGSTTFISPAGEKRVLVIHEETTWLTVHSTPYTDPALIERDITIPEVRDVARRNILEAP